MTAPGSRGERHEPMHSAPEDHDSAGRTLPRHRTRRNVETTPGTRRERHKHVYNALGDHQDPQLAYLRRLTRRLPDGRGKR